jgi:hypothetical protein
MQAFPEALGDGLSQSLILRSTVGHPLAIGCDRVFLVGKDPVEASSTRDHIPERRIVENADHLVAISAGEPVYRVLAGATSPEGAVETLQSELQQIVEEGG